MKFKFSFITLILFSFIFGCLQNFEELYPPCDDITNPCLPGMICNKSNGKCEDPQKNNQSNDNQTGNINNTNTNNTSDDNTQNNNNTKNPDNNNIDDSDTIPNPDNKDDNNVNQNFECPDNAPKNNCGFCGQLEHQPGESCGVCQGGQYVCENDIENTQCKDPLDGDARRPDQPCDCGQGVFRCAGNTLQCVRNDNSQIGDRCACGAGIFECDGNQLRCSAGVADACQGQERIECGDNNIITIPKVCLNENDTECSDGPSYPTQDCIYGCDPNTKTCEKGPCDNITCYDTSKESLLCEGNASVQYNPTGTCNEGVCSYGYVNQTTCAYGCENGNCKSNPCDTITCESSDPCKTGVCNPADGQCSYTDKANGDYCDDKNPCTINNHCDAGQCIGDKKECNNPLPSVCVDNVTLRTYTDSYCMQSDGQCSYSGVSYKDYDTSQTGVQDYSCPNGLICESIDSWESHCVCKELLQQALIANSNTGATKMRNPVLLLDPNDNQRFLISWIDNRFTNNKIGQGTNYGDIFFTSYNFDNSTNPIASLSTISVQLPNAPYPAAGSFNMIHLSDGSLGFIWSDARYSLSTPYHRDIVYAHTDTQGYNKLPGDANKKIVDHQFDGNIDAIHPDIAQITNSNLMVVWQDNRNNGYYRIFETQIDFDGNINGTTQQLNQVANVNQIMPAITTDFLGYYWAAYLEYLTGSTNYQVYVNSRFNGTQYNSVNLNSAVVGPSQGQAIEAGPFVDIAFDRKFGLVGVVYSREESGLTNVYLHVVDKLNLSSKGVIGIETIYATGVSVSSIRPMITADHNGGFYITYYLNNKNELHAQHIYVAAYNSNGDADSSNDTYTWGSGTNVILNNAAAAPQMGTSLLTPAHRNHLWVDNPANNPILWFDSKCVQ